METIGLIVSCIISLALIIYMVSREKKNQLQKVFTINVVLLFFCCLLLLIQRYCYINFNINPIIFEWLIYIPTCFLPVSVLFTGIIFANTKIELKKRYILVFIIPILSVIMLWTNEIHHLVYVKYSINTSETVFGFYWSYIHSTYTYLLYFIGLFKLLKYSIKNSGIFSKQAILFVIAALFPIVVNILGGLQIIPMSIYITPICFTVTLLLCAMAIFKFSFLNTAPIALQRIVDRMSDSYVVLNEDNIITDFNGTFLETFSLKGTEVRNLNIFDWEKGKKLGNLIKLKEALQKVSVSPNTVSFEAHFQNIDKYFNIEVSSIINKNMFLGTLILFKDITQHIQDMQTIQDNQDMLVERERFASLRTDDRRDCSQLKNSYNVYCRSCRSVR